MYKIHWETPVKDSFKKLFSLIFFQQLVSDPSPKGCQYFRGFQGSKLLNGYLVVWPNNQMLRIFPWFLRNCHWWIPLVTYAVVQRCSVKIVFLEISQNLQESTCASASFLIKLQKKETLAQVLSLEFCGISKNTFLHNTSGGCFFTQKTWKKSPRFCWLQYIISFYFHSIFILFYFHFIF